MVLAFINVCLNICLGEHMVKTITVTDEAYKHLKQMKSEDESFSQFIERAYHPRQKIDLREFLGILSKKEAEELGLDLEEATRWIEGLDRIHKTRRIQHCFDLSATPFAPTGKASTEEGLFGWIVSDFSFCYNPRGD